MFGMKAPSQLTQTVSGLRTPSSNYGQAVPAAYGHVRIGYKLIDWNNFQSMQQGGKKGGKGGSQTVYTVNADLLLGYGPFEGLGSVWQNQTWFYVNYSSQTFTGVGTNTVFNFTVSNNTSTFILIMGVQYAQTYSQGFVDYCGFGETRSFTLSGTTQLPLYNNQFPAPNYGTWANMAQPYATYNASIGTASVTVTFPVAVTAPVVTIYYIENGGVDQPQNTTGGKKGGGGIPTAIPGLVFERTLGSGPSGNPQAWTEFSGVGSANMPLGPTPELPFFNFEAKALYGCGNISPVASFNPSTGGYLAGFTSGDCNPADIMTDIICSGNRVLNSASMAWQHGLNFSAAVASSNAAYSYSRYGQILSDESNLWNSGSNAGLNKVRSYCAAYNIYLSGVYDSQQSAAQVLDELSKIANCAPVWDGASLDFIPYCEISSYGNGTAYFAPTAGGPVFNFTEQHFIELEDKSLLEYTRARPGQDYNSLQIGFKDAQQQWNGNFVLIADSMDIMQQGPMPGPQEQFDFITNATTAQSVGWSLLRRQLTMDRGTYRFQLPAYMEVFFTPMDLVTLYDPTLNKIPVAARITKIEISRDDKGKRTMKCEAKPFIYSGSAPLVPQISGTPPTGGGSSGGSGSAGIVNAPIFIETVPPLNPAGPQLWMCLSGVAPAYGGCAVWLSVDGGSTYGAQPIGVVYGRQTMGLVYNAAYPNHANPDNTDTLQVDLTQSLGTLTGVSSTGQNNLQSLCYLQGGGTITVNGFTLTVPYELIAYQGATLASANKYSCGPPILRGQFNTPTANHPIGSQFSFLLDQIVFRMNLIQSMIGQALYFKFTAFNATGANQQAVSSATPYTFTPTGLVGWSYNTGGTGGTTTTGTTGGANDLYLYVPGPYTSSQEIWSAQPVRNVTLPAGLTNSLASCDTAPTGSISLTINKVSGGVTTAIGTINFAAGATTGTFTFASAVTLNGTGDYLTVVAPATVDATLAGVRTTFYATRSN